MMLLGMCRQLSLETIWIFHVSSGFDNYGEGLAPIAALIYFEGANCHSCTDHYQN